MTHIIGKPAPSFSTTAVHQQEFKNVSLTDYRDRYVVLCFYPMDFTKVCGSEIAQLSQLQEEFRKRDCEVLAVSCDSHFTHLAWVNKLKLEKDLDVTIPLIADKSASIARGYGVYNEEQGVSSRATFLIDKHQLIQDMSINDRPVGRSLKVILQNLDLLRSDDEKDMQSRGLKRPLPEVDVDKVKPVKTSKLSDETKAAHLLQ